MFSFGDGHIRDVCGRVVFGKRETNPATTYVLDPDSNLPYHSFFPSPFEKLTFSDSLILPKFSCHLIIVDELYIVPVL